MTTIDALISARVHFPKPYSTPTKAIPKLIKPLNLTRKFQSRTSFLHRSFTVLCELQSSQPGDIGKPKGDDFVTRVLKENPSQVEPRFLVCNKIYTLKEKEDLSKGTNLGLIEILKKKLNSKETSKNESNERERETEMNSENDNVYLKDILREYKGKLYVPEQIFGAELSEEEEFQKNLEELPKMSLEDFRKAMKNDKVKLLTSKEVSGVSYVGGYGDFVLDLKDIPGDKSLQRTKW